MCPRISANDLTSGVGRKAKCSSGIFSAARGMYFRGDANIESELSETVLTGSESDWPEAATGRPAARTHASTNCHHSESGEPHNDLRQNWGSRGSLPQACCQPAHCRLFA